MYVCYQKFSLAGQTTFSHGGGERLVWPERLTEVQQFQHCISCD